MIFFGDPESRGVKEDAQACVAMAIEMQRYARRLQAEMADKALSGRFRPRIGINTGYCNVGNFGQFRPHGLYNYWERSELAAHFKPTAIPTAS